MVGSGHNQLNPFNALFVTPIADLRTGIADAATDLTPDVAATMDLSKSRAGINASIALYSYSTGTHTMQIQLWVDISAQGASTRKWIKLGTPLNFVGAVAGEGAYHRVDGLPSGLLAAQIIAVTTTTTVDIYEQHAM